MPVNVSSMLDRLQDQAASDQHFLDESRRQYVLPQRILRIAHILSWQQEAIILHNALKKNNNKK